MTDFVETASGWDLSSWDEAALVITMYAAPGMPTWISPEEVVRADDESDDDYATRQALIVELWSIPDNG